MREPGETPKFLGIGNRLSRVARGTSSADRMITADLLRAAGNAPLPVCNVANRLARRHVVETGSPFDNMDHLGRRMDRERMLREARPWTDVDGHFTSNFELSTGCLCEQCDHQVLKCDHANTKLHQLGIGQLRDLGLPVAETPALERTVWARAALVFPPREGHVTPLRRIQLTRLSIRHNEISHWEIELVHGPKNTRKDHLTIVRHVPFRLVRNVSMCIACEAMARTVCTITHCLNNISQYDWS